MPERTTGHPRTGITQSLGKPILRAQLARYFAVATRFSGVVREELHPHPQGHDDVLIGTWVCMAPTPLRVLTRRGHHRPHLPIALEAIPALLVVDVALRRRVPSRAAPVRVSGRALRCR